MSRNTTLIKLRASISEPMLEKIIDDLLLEDDFKVDEDCARDLTPHLIDIFERKMCALWKHNSYRVDHVIKPSFKELRDNLK